MLLCEDPDPRSGNPLAVSIYTTKTVRGIGAGPVLRADVFARAGMTASRYDDVWAIVPSRSHGYLRNAGELLNIEYDDHSAYAAGGLLSSLDDLLAFQRALWDGRLVPPALLQRMTTPVREDYGYGLQIGEAFGRSMVNHYGAIDGFSSHLLYFPADDLLLVALGNVGTESARATTCDLAAVMFGVAQPLLSALGPTRATAADLDRLPGSYGPAGSARVVERAGHGLLYRRGDQPLPMLPLGDGVFTLPGNFDVLLHFEADGGRVRLLRATNTCGKPLFEATRQDAAE